MIIPVFKPITSLSNGMSLSKLASSLALRLASSLSWGGMPRMAVNMTMSLALLALLAGCSDFRRAIGTAKSTPDEFEVVVRPPLSLPPNFNLRPQDSNIQQTAAGAPSAKAQASTLLVRRQASANSYDDLFAFQQIIPDIRAQIDEETAGILFERRLPLQMIFGGLPSVGPIIDKMAEDKRIRRNRLQEKAINEGATPAIDKVLDTPVLVK